jgi:hypothetical protein
MASKDSKKATKALGRAKAEAEEAATPRTPLGGPVWKILSVGATLIATKVASDAAQKGWKLATGRNVPVKGDYERERTRDVILFTALSSMLVSAARIAAERGAVSYYRNSSGHLPKRLEDQQVTPTDRKTHLKLDRAKRRSEFLLRRAIDRATP